MANANFNHLLGKDLSSLTIDDLRGLNHAIVDEINIRARSLRKVFHSGTRVIINHPSCAGKIYVVERTTPKQAVLREEFYTGPTRTRATLSLLTAIS